MHDLKYKYQLWHQNNYTVALNKNFPFEFFITMD